MNNASECNDVTVAHTVVTESAKAESGFEMESQFE